MCNLGLQLCLTGGCEVDLEKGKVSSLICSLNLEE